MMRRARFTRTGGRRRGRTSASCRNRRARPSLDARVCFYLRGVAGPSARKRKKPRTKGGRSRAETWRLKKLLQVEQGFWEQGFEFVAGVDEVGRGPLAGPVLAAAVIMPRGVTIRGVHDSKQLTAEKRERLVSEIREKALCIA